MQLVGGAKGHEQEVMQFLQQHLQKNKIVLSVSSQPSQERLAVTVLFHRVKPRLPTDELQSILSAGNASTVLHCRSPSINRTIHGALFCPNHSKQSLKQPSHDFGQFTK